MTREQNLLIADDDPEIIALLGDFFANTGWTVFTAQNGVQAVSLARNHPIDVALLDLKMPVRDGLDALKELKTLDVNTEVIIMTAYAEMESLNEILDRGAFDYVLKPFHRTEIVHTVGNALLKRQFAIENNRMKEELKARIAQLERDFEGRTRLLRESQIQYKQIVEQSNDAILVVQDGFLRFVNPTATELLGYSEKELLAAPFVRLVCPEDVAQVVARLGGNSDGRRSDTYSFRALRKNGEFLWIELNAVRTVWNGKAATLEVVRDVTERKKAEEALRESEERYRALFDRSFAAVYVHDFEGRFLDANDVALDLLGYSREEVLSIDIRALIGEEQLPTALETMKELIETGSQKTPSVYRVRTKDGVHLWLETQASVIYHNGRPHAVQGIARDVTKRKEEEARLFYLSTHDALTGLYNRAFFDDEIARIERGRRFPVSIVMVDVDGLKLVNDVRGHAAGDEILKMTASILQASCRAEDVVARVGGDEFAILLPDTDSSTVGEVVARIRGNVETQEGNTSISPLGLSLGTATAAKGASLSETVKRADMEMYRAKPTLKEEIP